MIIVVIETKANVAILNGCCEFCIRPVTLLSNGPHRKLFDGVVDNR